MTKTKNLIIHEEHWFDVYGTRMKCLITYSYEHNRAFLSFPMGMPENNTAVTWDLVTSRINIYIKNGYDPKLLYVEPVVEKNKITGYYVRVAETPKVTAQNQFDLFVTEDNELFVSKDDTITPVFMSKKISSLLKELRLELKKQVPTEILEVKSVK